MNRIDTLLTAAGIGLLSMPIFAEPGPWITFANETATRLVATPGLGTADPDEKDFAYGDLDQDGDDDLIVARKQPFTTPGRRPNVLFMSEGGVLVDRSAQFASASDVAGDEGFLTPTNDRDIAVADVNMDGWLDVITATTYGSGQPTHISHPRIYINLGDDASGNWRGLRYESARFPTLPDAPNFCAVAAGDITGDNAPELYFVDYDAITSSPFDDRLLINNGLGFFTDQTDLRMTTSMLDSAFGTAGAIADMNGDGRKDIMKDTALGFIRVSVSYNNPATPGFFPGPNLQSVVTGASYFTSVGDLNRDGRLDLHVTDDSSDHYHLNQGNNPGGQVIWSSATLPASGQIGGTTRIADLNNDNWNDIIMTGNDVDFTGCRPGNIYQNNGNPPNVTFSVANGGIPQSFVDGNYDAAALDINGDGWRDIVFGNCTGLTVWINQPPDPPPSPADLNDDGVVDGIDLGIVLAQWTV